MVIMAAGLPPGLAEKVQGLVEDAVSKGAKILAGGHLPRDKPGQFYPPTVLINLNKSMKIWEEEVFGPVSCILPQSHLKKEHGDLTEV
jgi:succinate-semialdehyde dehydrogenase/glutarate-semialdehyde dehydrogenase